ncbi:hypothetical protein CYLTODRAFT_433918 [Cylindrobasidium torrendii FP15055 ss-10]|uniref:TAFII55 protein conserved region domain-containing protein n=1 Tax=Cylindrobasidium torrendii FP15055 ss-10 TaxID=1314674 RepID=A0A0D7BTV7_9AGAR|nr:hypothetical protein CYLTODRAFT_433918 [Cylindrobasidium torrendii FP15055 ss-10]
MDDDIVVDVEGEAGPSTSQAARRPAPLGSTFTPTPAPAGELRASRLRSSSALPGNHPSEPAPNADRARAAMPRHRGAPKLRLKLNEKAANGSVGMSFLGPYDRELDSDDEELAFEEQFILRLPPGEDCDKLRKMVQSRDVSQDVWFKFKDSRRAQFHIGNNTYNSKLVDLPCIVESQKTLDSKQMFKVADICQMLVVGDRVENDEPLTNQKNFNIEEFIWPHGVTPPMHHVRKRRFRKRINRRTIESTEEAVERLLEEDALASEVKFDVLENVNPDLSDSEFIERDEPLDAPTPAISDMMDAMTPGDDLGEPEDDEDEDDDIEGDGDIDEELAAELDLALGDNDDEDDDEDEDEEDESDEEEVASDDEESQARKLISEEIRDLQAAVDKKGKEIASSANPLIRRRFEDALKKLTHDLETKIAQRDEFDEVQRLKKAGISIGQNDDDEESADEVEDNRPQGMQID